jgi:hypothetical protein
MKMVGHAIVWIFLALGATAANAQSSGGFGRQAGATAPPSDAASDPPGSSGGWPRKFDSEGRMTERDYRATLAGELAEAEALVGKPLTESDGKKIRSALQRDLIAWRKQYDPRRADYSSVHDQFLVDQKALSAEGWAKQRVAWLRAQQQWILANAGEIQAQAVRSR